VVCYASPVYVCRLRQGQDMKDSGNKVEEIVSKCTNVLPEIDGWVARAQEVAAVMAGYEKITIKPDPPHVNFFQLFIEEDHEALRPFLDRLFG
jgi:hypothetical protein